MEPRRNGDSALTSSQALSITTNSDCDIRFENRYSAAPSISAQRQPAHGGIDDLALYDENAVEKG
jgi:hypothetical protein